MTEIIMTTHTDPGLPGSGQGRGTSTYMTQNDPHVALSILTVGLLGAFFLPASSTPKSSSHNSPVTQAPFPDFPPPLLQQAQTISMGAGPFTPPQMVLEMSLRMKDQSRPVLRLSHGALW